MNKQEKIEKVETIVNEIKTCMMCTVDEDGQMKSRPMQTAKYDDDGNLWFFTDKTTAKINQLENQNCILLIYSSPSNDSYLSIAGKAIMNDELEKKKELFSVFTKAWFPNGPESAELILIQFTPTNAEFWDTTDSKLINLFKIGKAVIKGEKFEANEADYGNVNFD